MRVGSWIIAALGALLLSSPAIAQQPRSSSRTGVNTAGAPVPDAILKGRRAFVSYELGDVTAFPSHYSGGPERAYDEFYRQVKAWGRYELVADPKDADVIFAIRFVDPPEGVAQARLGIMDAHGRVSLWGFVEQVGGALFKKHRDNEFSDAIGKLIDDLKELVATGAAPPPA